jgi:hypothetical protein
MCTYMFFVDVVFKRTPMRLPSRPNDIFVCRNTKFAAMLDRAQRFLNAGCDKPFGDT